MTVPLEQGSVLAAVPGVRHGFTSRRGASAGRELTLAVRGSATHEEVAQNWSQVAAAVGSSSDRLALLAQVHGDQVIRVTAPGGPHAVVGEADAAYTTAPDVVLAVRTADCVPVLVAGPGVVAVAHAGWRGVAASVVPRLIEALRPLVAPSALAATIGPAISGEACEVGDEVVQALLQAGLAAEDFLHGSVAGRPHVDLQRAVGAQLAAAGLGAVQTIARCTATDPDLFSHRADGPAAGRQAGVIVRESES